MDPTVSRTLLSLLKSNPSTSNIPERFPLLFPDGRSTSEAANPTPMLPRPPHVGPAQVGTLVNVINTRNISKDGKSVSQLSAGEGSKSDFVEIPIKVFHPSRKRESKTYMLNFNVVDIRTLKCLREEILDQLGKNIIKFDLQFNVGYFCGSHKITFTEGENIKSELKNLKSKGRGKYLWCDGEKENIPTPSNLSNSVVTIESDSDGDCEPVPKKQKQKVSALDAKVLRVDKLANELQQKHGDKYNKIHYKLWAEALDVKKHDSREFPPEGPIWGSKKNVKRGGGVNEMASAFTDMAHSVASAFRPKEVVTPTKETPIKSGMGISPGRKIDLQDKLFRQIDMLHHMFEKGAITSQQYEKRRENTMTQLDQLSET